MGRQPHDKRGEGGEMKELILKEYWDLAYKAYCGTSFSPEDRANQTIAGYSEELENDLIKLGDNAGNYKEKYINYFTAWLNAKSRCLSTMIAGPSNFPTRRAQKANNAESNKWNEFNDWRNRYFKAVNRVKTLSPEEDLDNKLKTLDKLIIRNENVKSMNKIISSGYRKKLSNDEIAKQLIGAELITEGLKKYFVDPDYLYGGKIQKMSTLGVKIKAARDSVLVLKARIERKKNWEDIDFEDGCISISDDRVKIYHNDKPEQKIRTKLKSNGFRWSPTWKCWCRKHTVNALIAAKRIVGVE